MNRPNILLFLTDDHAPWSLPAYGHSEMTTPNFDRLAREGVVFENAFTPCPVCSPARACLMTGRTPSQVGVHDWLEESISEIGDRDWLADELTLPQRLQSAGYHTLLAGKWHLGSCQKNPPGFDHVFGLARWQGGHNEKHTYHLDGEPQVLEGNKSKIITDHALQLLDAAPAGHPFFLNVGYIATHSSYEAAAHDPERVREVADLSYRDLPEYRPHPWLKNEGMATAPSVNDAQLRSRYAGYHAAVRELDLQVGRLLGALEQRGELENTLVIYVSDHGCAIGHQGFFGKGNSTRPLNMYDTSLRVPLLIRGPGIVGGQRVSENVDHYDLFEAILEWAGLQGGGADFPGLSLAPLAQGKSVGWQSERFGEYGDLRMIRTTTYKFVKRYPSGPYELFDLIADPDETFNLAGWEHCREVQAELDARLEHWYSLHEDPEKSGIRVKELPRHNSQYEAWRDGRREARGLQVY